MFWHLLPRRDPPYLSLPRSIIMTASSTLLALLLMPLCLWLYSRPWIHTALVRLLPLGAVSLTLGSTLLPIGLGVLIRYRYPRAADLLVKVRARHRAPERASVQRRGSECTKRGRRGLSRC